VGFPHAPPRQRTPAPWPKGDDGLTSVPVPFFNGAWPIFKVGKSRRPLTDTERDMVAEAIVEHIKLCNWKVERGPPWEGFAYLGRRSESK
jgi:hypothetical protein